MRPAFFGEIAMRPFACGAIALCLMPLTPARAQNQTVDDLKGKIFDAHMVKQTFGGGLKFCSEFDGKHFYFQAQDRVLDMEGVAGSIPAPPTICINDLRLLACERAHVSPKKSLLKADLLRQMDGAFRPVDGRRIES
jgi:hypothetical protein